MYGLRFPLLHTLCGLSLVHHKDTLLTDYFGESISVARKERHSLPSGLRLSPLHPFCGLFLVDHEKIAHHRLLWTFLGVARKECFSALDFLSSWIVVRTVCCRILSHAESRPVAGSLGFIIGLFPLGSATSKALNASDS